MKVLPEYFLEWGALRRWELLSQPCVGKTSLCFFSHYFWRSLSVLKFVECVGWVHFRSALLWPGKEATICSASRKRRKYRQSGFSYGSSLALLLGFLLLIFKSPAGKCQANKVNPASWKWELTICIKVNRYIFQIMFNEVLLRGGVPGGHTANNPCADSPPISLTGAPSHPSAFSGSPFLTPPSLPRAGQGTILSKYKCLRDKCLTE